MSVPRTVFNTSWGSFLAVAGGCIGGGMVGFKVMHEVEERYRDAEARAIYDRLEEGRRTGVFDERPGEEER